MGGEQLFPLGRGAVAVVGKNGQGVVQAGGQVKEGGGEIFLPGRVVPEKHRQTLVLVGQALQPHQIQSLGHHGGGLGGQGLHASISLVDGGGHLDIRDPGVFGLGQVERHVHQGDPGRIGGPGGPVPPPVGDGLDHGQAQGGKFPPPAFRIEHDLGVDDHVGQGLALVGEQGL